MAGNKKISQLVDGGAGQAADKYVIERGNVNFFVSYDALVGNPGGLDLSGIVNDFIVKDEKAEVALEQRQTLPPAKSFVDNTAVPPTEVDGDIYLLDDTGASDPAWDGNGVNTWVRFDGTATLWRGITALDGFFCTLEDTGSVRHFDPTTSAWEIFGGGAAAGANTEIQFNAAGVFGASSLFTFDTGFGVFSCDAAAVFNEGGTDQDFRVESLNVPEMFIVNAGIDKVGIGGIGVPEATCHVWGPSGLLQTDLTFKCTSPAAGGDTFLVNGFGVGFVTTPKTGFNAISAASGNIGWVFTNAVGDSRQWGMANDITNFGDWLLRTESVQDGGLNTTRIYVDKDGNTSFGGITTFGTGAVKVFAMANGTAPSTNPADMFQAYSLDHNGAGTATLHVENEEGNTFIYISSAAYTRDAVIVEDRTLLASASATTINNNNVLAALIADLQPQGLIG